MQGRVSSYESFASCVVLSRETILNYHILTSRLVLLWAIVVRNRGVIEKTMLLSHWGLNLTLVPSIHRPFWSLVSLTNSISAIGKGYGDFAELLVLENDKVCAIGFQKNICMCSHNVITKAFKGEYNAVANESCVETRSRLHLIKSNSLQRFHCICTRVKRKDF